MAKKKKFLWITILLVLTAPTASFAQREFTPTDIRPKLEEQFNIMRAMNLSNLEINNVLSNVLLYILGTIGVLSVVCIVIAGIMYITAAGDEDRVEKAKKMLTYSVIGLAVALLSLVILIAINFVISTP